MSEFSKGHDRLDAIKCLINRPEPEELRTATVVIQDVVSTSEKKILRLSDLDNISGHSTYEIRAALSAKARQIMSMPGSRFRTETTVEVSKQAKDGIASLWLSSRVDSHGNLIPGLSSINLEWESENPPKPNFIRVNFPLQEAPRPRLSIHGEYHSTFGEWRNGRKSVSNSQGFGLVDESDPELVALRELQKGGASDLSTVRHLWKGLRWLSANLNAWETPDFIMPEDLARQSARALPKPIPPPQLKTHN